MNRHSWTINQPLAFLAYGLVILALLKASSSLLTPLLLAIAVSIVLAPLMERLTRKGVPRIAALILILSLAVIPIFFFGGYVAEEAHSFAENYQSILTSFWERFHELSLTLKAYGITLDEEKVRSLLQESNLGIIFKHLALQAKRQFSNIFLILFMVAFMLMESKFFRNKILRISKEYNLKHADFLDLMEKIKSYFLLKVKTSLITALWVFAVLWYYEIPYDFMLALLAFFFNFIPVIGSILAAIPAILLTLLSHGFGTTLWVAVWYLIINTVIGNILEPRIMGRGLGLSPLVIFLSMTFWGWIFGPTGMVLSVPLTMVLQFFFGRYEETRWISLMLSDYAEEKPSQLL